jgi:GT2 family glycosyltransferase
MRLGVEQLSERLDAVLLLTHECLLAPDALRELTSALDEDGTLGAVGPLLEDADSLGAVWSSGGHVDRRSWTPLNDRDRPAARTRRDWLDGAAILLRAEVVDLPDVLDDRYFLYLEDVHLGLAVAAAGWGVAVVPMAVASQTSGGMPVYFAARNRLLLIRRWGGTSAVVRRLAFDALSLARDAVTPARRYLLPIRLRGLRDGLSGAAGPPPPGIDGSAREVSRQ